MPRIQLAMHGAGPRSGSTWAVTSQWATASGPASAGAFTTVLSQLQTALAASTPFKAGISTNFPVQGIHGLYYSAPAGPATLVADSGGAAVVGTAQATIPPLAVVVSERTDAAGPSNRGRSYWPYAQPDTSGVITTAIQTVVRNSWLAFHTAAIAAMSTAGWAPIHVVYSRKTGNMTPISYIQTGDRVDTARGRFGDAPESYASSNLPASVEITPEQAGLDPEDQAAIDFVNQFGGDSAWTNKLLGPLGQLAVGLVTKVKVVPAVPPAP